MDILADYRAWQSQQEERIGTHSDDCHLWPRHERCMIHRLAREVERLRLTDGERRALEFAVGVYPLDDSIPDTLRGLLERTKTV